MKIIIRIWGAGGGSKLVSDIDNNTKTPIIIILLCSSLCPSHPTTNAQELLRNWALLEGCSLVDLDPNYIFQCTKMQTVGQKERPLSNRPSASHDQKPELTTLTSSRLRRSWIEARAIFVLPINSTYLFHLFSRFPPSHYTGADSRIFSL